MHTRLLSLRPRPLRMQAEDYKDLLDPVVLGHLIAAVSPQQMGEERLKLLVKEGKLMQAKVSVLDAFPSWTPIPLSPEFPLLGALVPPARYPRDFRETFERLPRDFQETSERLRRTRTSPLSCRLAG